jgi:hypothetical protein
MRIAGIVAVLVASILTSTGTPVIAQAPDSHSLLGEWSGTWASQGPDRGAANGQYTLTIKNIDGARAFCHLYSTSAKSSNSVDFVAKLEGNTLSWSGQFPTQLTINGNEMKGVRQGGRFPADIALKKK